MPSLTCPHCGYTWDARTDKPKKCPNPKCQAALNYPAKKQLSEST